MIKNQQIKNQQAKNRQRKNQSLSRVAALIFLMTGALSTAACQLELARMQNQLEPEAAQQPGVNGLVIENDTALPETYPRGYYEVRLQAHGGVPVLHWRLETGAPPPGIKLEDDGLLHGQAGRTGEFQFTVSVRDGGKPEQAVRKGFTMRVRSALTLNWKSPAHVNGNRIEGSVVVSNTTPDDMDLTFVVLAVAANGRATAIGYQHFVMAPGTLSKELPFGETLPKGGYVIHADAVGEVPPKDVIYRERLQTPAALQVAVGP
jgi:hypothetical protein